MDYAKDISLGNNEWIRWIEFDAELIVPKNIDYLIEPMISFWKRLEKECVSECCGIEAFSFKSEDIYNANREANILNLDDLVNKAIIEVSEFEEQIIMSGHLNQLINKDVFLKLLKHVKKNLKSN